MPNIWDKFKQIFSGSKSQNDLLTGKTILTVDDEPSQRHFIEAILKKKGVRVLTAENGQQGIDVARKEKPDLILLDLVLPDLNGKQVCQTLKNEFSTRDIPVIFLTGSSTPRDVVAEFELGAELHLNKPINAGELIDQIETTLSEKTDRTKA